MKISEQENDTLAMLMGLPEGHKVTSGDLKNYLHGSTGNGLYINHITVSTWVEKFWDNE
ncbi:MAG: hypothetical protein KAS66_05160 [Candidatus Omnitrophica bacterium]|nr:hypothetical protein [Candidatus Omnitrophota bacterium]